MVNKSKTVPRNGGLHKVCQTVSMFMHAETHTDIDFRQRDEMLTSLKSHCEGFTQVGSLAFAVFTVLAEKD